AHCQEGFIPVMDAPWAHASIGSQRREAGFRRRLYISAEQSSVAVVISRCNPNSGKTADTII
ncbi:MAG: hypothetical protein JSV31_02415, partial [Desulfobacterales bacterium]